MSANQLEAPVEPIIYPDSDGQPMADNTKQFRWIMTLVGGLETLFADDPKVFVAGDLLWYPVEGDNKTRIAPDALAAFGRPKGDRGSYKQWEEAGIAPQVVSGSPTVRGLTAAAGEAAAVAARNRRITAARRCGSFPSMKRVSRSVFSAPDQFEAQRATS